MGRDIRKFLLEFAQLSALLRAAEICEGEVRRFSTGVARVPVDYIIPPPRVDLSREFHQPPPSYTHTRALNIHERDLRLSSDEITPDGFSVLIGTCTYRPNKLQIAVGDEVPKFLRHLPEDRLSIPRIAGLVRRSDAILSKTNDRALRTMKFSWSFLHKLFSP